MLPARLSGPGRTPRSAPRPPARPRTTGRSRTGPAGTRACAGCRSSSACSAAASPPPRMDGGGWSGSSQASPVPDQYCWAMRADTSPDRTAIVAALLRVVAAGACWALAAVLGSYAFDRGVPPVRLAEARVAVALVALAPFLAWRRPDLLRPPPGTWPVLATFGACVAAVNLSYYLAIDRLPVGVAVALQYTGPAILMAATALLLRDRAGGAPPGGGAGGRARGGGA